MHRISYEIPCTVDRAGHHCLTHTGFCLKVLIVNEMVFPGRNAEHLLNEAAVSKLAVRD